MSEELEALARRVINSARPDEQIEIYAARSKDTEVVVYESEVESLSSADSGGFGIRVIDGAKQGFAYSASLDLAALEETLADARDNARFTSDDRYVGLASPDDQEVVNLDLWRDDLNSFSPKRKVELALELEAKILAASNQIKAVESASWGDSSLEAVVATTTGIFASSRRTVCYLSATAVAIDGDETQIGSGYSVARSPGDLDIDKACDDSVLRATRLLGAKKPKSAHGAVVMEPRITAVLLSVLSSALDGEAVSKGTSLFVDRLGEQVAAPIITLVDDPTDPDAYGAGIYDAEGLASRRNVLINNGQLDRFLYNTYAARRVGAKSTASAVRAGFKGLPGVGARAMALKPGEQSAEEIIASVGDGLLVSNVLGVHSGVNPISGDFSVGAEGFMIRNGQVAEPVREATIASTMQRMLSGVLAVGSDVERLPGSASGVTICIDDVAISGS